MLAGCGYKLGGVVNNPVDGKTVAVDMFANRTYQANVEAFLRQSLVSELARRNADIVNDGKADMKLSGEIENITIDAVAYSAQDTAAMYRVTMTVRAELSDQNSHKSTWKGRETLTQEYPAMADLSLQRNAKDAALEALCKSMAEALVLKLNALF